MVKCSTRSLCLQVSKVEMKRKIFIICVLFSEWMSHCVFRVMYPLLNSFGGKQPVSF